MQETILTFFLSYCLGGVLFLTILYLLEKDSDPMRAIMTAAVWPVVMVVGLVLGWFCIMLSLALGLADGIRWVRRKLLW